MSESLLVTAEIIFNILYLIGIWTLVLFMLRGRDRIQPQDTRTARYFFWAFFLLAFGDTFHVGSRVIAYLSAQGLELNVNLLGRSFGLVGWSSLVTAITVTIFYLLLLLAYLARFQKRYTGWISGLFVIGGVRLGLLLLPINDWNQVVPPQPWGTIRNIPLIVVGLAAAFYYLRSAAAEKDREFFWIGIMILLSYLFYLPVILFVQSIPALGMLMIPKTLAYVALGIFAVRALYFRELERVARVDTVQFESQG